MALAAQPVPEGFALTPVLLGLWRVSELPKLYFLSARRYIVADGHDAAIVRKRYCARFVLQNPPPHVRSVESPGSDAIPIGDRPFGAMTLQEGPE